MKNSKKGKILVAMSGGVDSSAVAVLVKEQGYDVVGATMRLFDPELDGEGCKSCCSLTDALDASSVAGRLEIDFEVMDMRRTFRDEVIRRFISSYEKGETPNPCIECNKHMKLEHMWDYARSLGCDCMATGHYVRIEEDQKGRPILKKAINAAKDQSYVLYMIPRQILGNMRFPLGNIESKDMTREIVRKAGLSNFRKRESQDICFVPDGDYAGFIEKETGKTYSTGDFVDEDGNILGRHNGLIHYTIGQRKGLGISALPEPYYVKKKSVKDNRIIVVPNDQLYSEMLTAADMNWLLWDDPPEEFRCSAKIRYRQKEQPCTVRVIKDAGSNNSRKDRDVLSINDLYPSITVTFDEPQRAITPGQAVVLYDGDVVLGGGTIV